MTRKDEFIERLENYLDEYEGITPLPDAVRDAIRAELPKTKQIGPVSGLERFLSMTLQLPASARYGLAAAAVLVAVVIGASIFSGGGSVGGDGDSQPPSPSSTSTAAATATGPMNLVESPEEDNLPAGKYYLDLPAYPARIEFELPAGWWHFYDAHLREESTAHALLVLDSFGGNGSAWGLAFALADRVPADPCRASAGYMDPSVTQSADALADAFSSWEVFPASVEDVTLSGFSGKRVEITSRDVPCEAVFFNTPSGYDFGPVWPTSGPLVNQLTLLDVEGSVLVIWTTDFPATTEFEVDGGASPDPDAHAEDQPQLHGILDSIVIQPR